MFLSGIFKKKSATKSYQKANIMSVFNHEQESKKEINKNFQFNESQKRIKDFFDILNQTVVDLTKLRNLSWNGIPQDFRSMTWKLLLKYMPTNKNNRLTVLSRKREDYMSLVQTYLQQPKLELDNQQKKSYKLIQDDVVRTMPGTELFRIQKIQKMMKRVLYIWHTKHPGCGYVQGINDIAAPFLIVFLSDHLEFNCETLQINSCILDAVQQGMLNNVQADVYWCLSKFLDSILDNYTHQWPGIVRSYNEVLEVVTRVDNNLIQHFQEQGIDFYQLYFKWIACLLLRQFSTKTSLRYLDVLLSADGQYFNLTKYTLAAIILKYSKKLKKMKFQALMSFQQKMPTRQWTQQDLATIIAQAYVYQKCFTSN